MWNYNFQTSAREQRQKPLTMVWTEVWGFCVRQEFLIFNKIICYFNFVYNNTKYLYWENSNICTDNRKKQDNQRPAPVGD